MPYSSANATVIGLVCDGLDALAVQTPSMLLNQPRYWGMQTWPDQGTQSCGISAHNSLGEVAIVYFDLVVGPAGFGVPSSGGAGAELSYPPGDPRNPAPTGSSATSGHPQVYVDANGNVFSDPAGTIPCGTCNTGSGLTVNANPSNPSYDPPYTGGGEGE